MEVKKMNDLIYMVYEALNEYDEKSELFKELFLKDQNIYIRLIDDRCYVLDVESVDMKQFEADFKNKR